MKIAFLTPTPPAATKNGRRISFISRDLGSTDPGATPPNGLAARRSNRHDA